MPIFPGDYATATEVDADDKFLMAVDGVVQGVPSAVAKILMNEGQGYTEIIDMVRDVGCDPTATADDTARIQAVIDTEKGSTNGKQLYFPSPVKIDGPLVIGGAVDLDAKLHFKGSGRRMVEIRQLDNESPTLDMRNDGQNLRGVMVSDLTLRYGNQQAYLGACAYNLFQNVTFMQGGEGTTGQKQVVIENGSHMNYFDNCWWVHGASNADALGVSSGTAYFTNCIFGEDIGNLYIGDFARFSNCRFHYATDDVAADGYQSMGKAMFTVPNGGELHLHGCTMFVVTNMANMDNAQACSIIGCNIVMGTGPVLKVRNTDAGRPMRFTGNHVTWQGNGLFYASTLGEHLQNSVFTDNTFEVDTGFTTTIDDALLNPRYRNVWRNNTHRLGAI